MSAARRRSATSRLTIIVTGLIAQHPRMGGIAWHYGQYAAGLSQLGHEVFYFEDSGEWPYTEDGGPNGDEWIAKDCSVNIAHLDATLSRWGMGARWAYRFPPTGEWFGMSDARREDVARSADLLVNVSGTLEFPERYRDVRCLAYIDSDPVFTQSRIINGTHGLAERVAAHDVHFSFGERIAGTRLDTGHRWIPTRQPVLLSEWHPDRSTNGRYTTVMNWTSYSPAVVNGEQYGQKDREFARFIEVAREVAPIEIEIALGRTQHSEWENAAVPGVASKKRPPRSPHEVLAGWGWRVVESNACCGDPSSYRDFIESSKGEWSVAKEAYVAFQPGWFSERSACYLAAGRPVIVQDTGFAEILPVGEGILAFRTADQAVEALREVEDDYERHAGAARSIAEDFFDSADVLDSLVEQATGVHA